MPKTQEELNTLKSELEALNNKIKELDEEELDNIAGGMISFEPLYEFVNKYYMNKYQLPKDAVLTPDHITRLITHHNFFEDFCKKHNIDLEELLEYINNKKKKIIENIPDA